MYSGGNTHFGATPKPIQYIFCKKFKVIFVNYQKMINFEPNLMGHVFIRHEAQEETAFRHAL
jgi:hypothetical protein